MLGSNTKLTSVLAAFVILAACDADAKKIDGDQLFSPQKLVEVRIELPAEDWNKLRVQARNPASVFGGGPVEEDPYSYFKADIWINGTKIKSVGIRKKGLFGSADNDRPSLKVKFDEYVDQDPIDGLSRLTLNNNKQDRSQLNQFITYKLFRDAGLHAPRSSLARLTVNGVYLGIYTNVESIKKPFLQNSFGDKTGNLYEGTLTDFHPKTLDKLEVKTNEDNNDRRDIRRLIDLLGADGDLNVDEVGKVINLDHFMRFWAIEAMVGFWDGYNSNQNNFYYYVNPADGLGYFIPWGADYTLSDGGPFAQFSQQANSAIYAQSILANRLYRSEGVPERYRETMLKLMDQIWNEESLVAEIDRMEQLIEHHLHASQRDTPQRIENLRRFIRTRRQELTRELNQWPATIPTEPRKPMYTVTVGHAKGTFITQWNEKPGSDDAEPGNAELQMTLDGKVVDLDQITVSAQRLQFPGFGGPPGGPVFGGPPRGPGFGGPPRG
ncbi:MAG: CotH kinase family protein, partial [Planctomycetales bacterium]|nr:CotH kinase family protein [Planctomycetales bacterium]